MPARQGGKIYCQLLIDPHRYALIEEMAVQADMRVTAMIRELVYVALESKVNASIYREAKARDEAIWAESIRKRVEGRLRSRAKTQETQPEAVTK